MVNIVDLWHAPVFMSTSIFLLFKSYVVNGEFHCKNGVTCFVLLKRLELAMHTKSDALLDHWVEECKVAADYQQHEVMWTVSLCWGEDNNK